MPEAQRQERIDHSVSVRGVWKVQIINARDITNLLKFAAVIVLEEHHQFDQPLWRDADTELVALGRQQERGLKINVMELLPKCRDPLMFRHYHLFLDSFSWLLLWLRSEPPPFTK